MAFCGHFLGQKLGKNANFKVLPDMISFYKIGANLDEVMCTNFGPGISIPTIPFTNILKESQKKAKKKPKRAIISNNVGPFEVQVAQFWPYHLGNSICSLCKHNFENFDNVQ